ncbi:MAG: hypothetical protein JWL93_2257 [Hyphomicrobiales bacterium]|jgi:hypothetical protein|nr:hypothetical protein [Hyphomicrobiales bacterium]
MDQKDRDARINLRAYDLWVAEGRPEGRADIHWDKASELVAIEESQQDTTMRPDRQGEPVESLVAVENAGEFPTLTDEGEEKTAPSRDNLRDADEPPLGTRAA